MKHILHIFGASGSGTSTLARRLCDELGYTFMDTDDYFWVPTDPPFTTCRTVEDRLNRIRQDFETAQNAVLSGSLGSWGSPLLPYFTLGVRIEMDQDLRIQRLHQRDVERFGPRIAPGGDMYAQHLEFLEWAKRYDTGGLEVRSKAKHDLWQSQLPCPTLLLDGADTVENHVQNVLKALNL